MTEDDLDELLRGHPRLWHMAEAGSWPLIRQHGLLSTSALLDRFDLTGPDRERIESARRPEKVRLERAGAWAVVRDNKPLNEAKLTKALQDDLTPDDWYRLLNGRVFFWLTFERLLRLLNARPYRGEAHDVIEVASAPLVAAHRGRVTLAAINTGNTEPFAHPRGRSTFLPIEAYPLAERRARRLEPAVELAVAGGVPDIARFATRVTRMRGDREEAVLWRAAPTGSGAPGEVPGRGA